MTAKRQWTLFTALACAVVLIAGYMLLVRPQHSKAASVKTQTASVQTQVQSLHAQLARLLEEQRNIVSQQAALARIAQQLPADPQLPTLLRKIDAAAASSGVDLVNLAPGNPAAVTLSAVPAVAPSPSSSGVAAEANAATSTTTPGAAGTVIAGLAQIPVALTVAGGYFQIERFLDSIEGLQRSMLVTGFSLGYKGALPSTGSVPTVGAGEINATISTQVFESTAALGSAGASTTP